MKQEHWTKRGTRKSCELMKWIVEYLQDLQRTHRISKHEFQACMSVLFEWSME